MSSDYSSITGLVSRQLPVVLLKQNEQSRGSADVLEQLSSISDVNLPTHFVRKLSSILEHTKDEIVECLKPKPIQVLKQLREHVLCELVTNLLNMLVVNFM